MQEHQATQQEVADLLAVADRDLKDCRTPNLGTDWQFNIAYNGALQLATAALAATGYRAERANHNHRVIHSLEFTIGADAAFIRKFDLFRKKRNISDYERAHTISEFEAAEMRELAEDLRAHVHEWLRKHHPRLTP